MLVVSFSAVTAMDVRAVSVTMSTVWSLCRVSPGTNIESPCVAVMVTGIPVTDPAVTMPDASTVAIASLDEVQVIYDDTFCVGETPLDS